MIDLSKYINKEDKLVLAISGGIDSVVLLDLVSKKHPRNNLIVASVDHGIRDNSRKDAEFVSNLAKKYGILFKSTRLNLQKKDENTARNARYLYLKEIKLEFGAKYILTAHHLNDLLETIILNLTRGSGPLRLWGMQELSGDLLRPMIKVKKSDIKEYAKKNKLKYIEDETNRDLSYARNRIRHKVIPELLKINSEVLGNVLETSKLAAELSEYIDYEVDKLLESDLSVEKLKASHPYIVKEVIKRKLHEMLGKKSDIYRKNVEEVYNLIYKDGTKKTEIAGMVITKNYKKLKFNDNCLTHRVSYNLAPNNSISFNNFNLKSYFGKTEISKNNILLDPNFEYNLKVRNWEKGDSIKTVSGTKKLSDIFTNAKISQDERKKWPIVVSGDDIIWVPKLAASVHAKNLSNKYCLIIEVE